MRTAILALVLLAGTASVASAQTPAPALLPPPPGSASTVFTPSVLASFGGGATTNFGIGAQVRLDWYPTAAPFRFGGWLTGEVVGGDTPRISGGLLSGMWLFDCELGLSYRAANDTFAGSLGLVIGKDINLGFGSIGGRLIIPLADFPSNAVTRTQGIEGMVVLTIGFPLSLDGGATRHPYDCHGCHGCHGHSCPHPATPPPA